MKLALFDDYIPGVVNGDRIVDLSSVVGKSVMGLRPRYRMPTIISQFAGLRADGGGAPVARVAEGDLDPPVYRQGPPVSVGAERALQSRPEQRKQLRERRRREDCEGRQPDRTGCGEAGAQMFVVGERLGLRPLPGGP